jgi:Xaa-Pro aminopeptidase
LETEISLGMQLAHQRRTRLQAALADSGFDAVVLTTPESILYATGFRSVSAAVFTDYLMAAVVTPTQVRLIVAASEVAAALDSGVPPEGLLAYGKFFFEGTEVGARFNESHPDFTAAVTSGLSAVAGGASVLAVEAPARVGSAWSGLVDEMVDATEWVMSVRAIKLPDEQGLLRQAALIAEQGITAGIASITDGCRERDIARVVASTMAAAGGTPRFVVVTSGHRSALSDAYACERILRPGDLVRFDIGCVYQGYWSDIARTAVVGPPSARQASYYAALRAGVAAEVERVRPGMTAGELFDIAVNTVRGGGLTHYQRHHVGHAIGLSVYERPVITPNATTILQPGMVFCLETPYYELGWGGMMLEDTGVLTDTGFELFTSIDRDLVVVSR